MAPIRSSLFDLSLRYTSQKMVIALYFPQKKVTTHHMPQIISLLKKELPSILLSRCFNTADLPFSEEVKSTELGHLFEHMLLEYLCLMKLSEGFTEACFSGVTSWNWNKKKVGTFSVTLSLKKNDYFLVSPALQKTIRLFNTLLQEDQSYSQKLHT